MKLGCGGTKCLYVSRGLCVVTIWEIHVEKERVVEVYLSQAPKEDVIMLMI